MINFGDREGEEPPPRPGAGTGGEGPEEPFFDPFANWYDPAPLPQFEVAEVEEGAEGWEAAPVAAPAERAAGGGRLAVTVREVVETLVLAALIFLAVRASFQNFRVEGASMTPSLDNGQYLIVNKLAYATIDLSIFDWVPFFDAGEDSVHHLFGAPSRGDVVVFRSPTASNRDFIKRIIGEPGDVVTIDQARGTVLVNGKSLEEPYVSRSTNCVRTCGPWVVPKGHYFVLGDNRQNSSDSRQGWFVPEENIVGKAFFSYWPLDEAGLAPNHSVSFATEAED